MSRSAIATSAKPRFIVPGTAALDPGVERYVVRGGGSAVFALERDDLLEIALLEGGQAVEIVAFGKGGKSDLAAIGLKGKGKPEGLQNILASGSDDAERVRFGLFRRGLELGRASCAKLFGTDAPAGEAVNLKAERAAVVVVSAPAAGMLVWDQTPPTDVLVFITRARVLAPGELRLPEPLTAPRLDFTINIASAESFEVAEGEYIQIVDIAGRQCSDFLAFNRRALDNNEVLGIELNDDAHRTRPGLSHTRALFEVPRPQLQSAGRSPPGHRRPPRHVRSGLHRAHLRGSGLLRPRQLLGQLQPRAAQLRRRQLHRLARHQLLLQYQRRRR